MPCASSSDGGWRVTGDPAPGSPEDVGALYDRGVDGYDRYRALWLRLAGGGAEEAMVADARTLLRPGLRVLDAGCGTGALSRRLLSIQPDLDLTMLDISPGMLDRTRDIPGSHELGSIQALPYGPGSFDLIVSAWVIETVPPRRVLSRAGSAWLRAFVAEQFAGEFLAGPRVPWHDCGQAHLQRFRGGLTTEVSLSSCCTIDRTVLPSRDPHPRLIRHR